MKHTPSVLEGRFAGQDRERGEFAALTLAIMAPFVIVVLLLVAAFGRVSRGRELVDQAAQAASRAGSLSYSPGSATTAAQQAARETLSSAGISCSSMTVDLDTNHFYAGGEVVARVTCHADLSGLTISGVPGSITLTASSASPLETYRQFGGGR